MVSVIVGVRIRVRFGIAYSVRVRVWGKGFS